MSPWLWVIVAALFLLGMDHSKWTANLRKNLALLWTWGERGAGGATKVVGSRLGNILLGAVLCLLVMNGAKWLPGLVDFKWPVWVPSVVVPVVPESGPRQIILAYESQNASPQLKGALVLLRSGPVADRLKSKQHTLDIIDLDSKDAQGQPAPAVVKWKAQFPGLQSPALIISSGDKVVHSEVLTTAATADSIDVIVRAHE